MPFNVLSMQTVLQTKVNFFIAKIEIEEITFEVWWTKRIFTTPFFPILLLT